MPTGRSKYAPTSAKKIGASSWGIVGHHGISVSWCLLVSPGVIGAVVILLEANFQNTRTPRDTLRICPDYIGLTQFPMFTFDFFSRCTPTRTHIHISPERSPQYLTKLPKPRNRRGKREAKPAFITLRFLDSIFKSILGKKLQGTENPPPTLCTTQRTQLNKRLKIFTPLPAYAVVRAVAEIMRVRENTKNLVHEPTCLCFMN